jgi:hypothetical protein
MEFENGTKRPCLRLLRAGSNIVTVCINYDFLEVGHFAAL